VSGPRIVTLTLNPAIDVSSEADEVRHTHKTRTYGEQMEAGGGGINVARVLVRLGADVTAVFMGGGVSGQLLDALLSRAGIERQMIEIGGDTRMSLTVYERSSGNEFRFVPQGPELSTGEWSAALNAAASVDCDYLIASGSLPRGVPDDFYVRLAEQLRGRRIRLVLDTSGNALRVALQGGGLFLVKPSLHELEELAGRALPKREDVIAEAQRIVSSGSAEIVTVTLGSDGAVLVTSGESLWLPALDVRACSAVGAGDSFLAATIHGLATGLGAPEAFRLGMAGGAAAVLSCGSELATAEDIWRLYDR
jgi:6-phosphofructokinase 2